MQEIYGRFGKVIRLRRVSRGMSTAAVAKRVRMSRSNLTAIELGRQRVLLHQIPELAKVLGFKPEDLIAMCA